MRLDCPIGRLLGHVRSPTAPLGNICGHFPLHALTRHILAGILLQMELAAPPEMPWPATTRR
ncbi:MAG: hypothetical protein IBX69_14640 [Anaerolineales bacterium]|nr:hypothetical protein [Anaerolineales bacterium]